MSANVNGRRLGWGHQPSIFTRLLLFALVLAAHGMGLLFALHLKTMGGSDKPPGVLQVRWIETEPPDDKPPATPEPEPDVAPRPLPMRPQPAPPRPQPRAKPSPLLAIPAETPSLEGLSTVAPESETPETDAPAANALVLPQGAIATGGETGATQELTAPIFEADYLANPAPEYPSLSRKEGEQGLVTLYIHITPAGRADKVMLHKSSGFARLDKAASEVVWRWRFVPARRGQENVAGWVLVPIRFILRS
ncbi:MAG: energy transducer TonB [Zoogloeaceae bacterium]|jgi:protein TonB|nr:energy transducer TonB [Zoogloeaceae bacterium]